jgi:hypothetical protein
LAFTAPGQAYDITDKFSIGGLIAGAYLNGKNYFDSTHGAEVYWRFVINDYLAVTADVQYIQDKFDTDEDDIEGIIGGIRLTTEF